MLFSKAACANLVVILIHSTNRICWLKIPILIIPCKQFASVVGVVQHSHRGQPGAPGKPHNCVQSPPSLSKGTHVAGYFETIYHEIKSQSQ